MVIGFSPTGKFLAISCLLWFVLTGLDPFLFGAVYFLFWGLGAVSPDTLFGGRTHPFVLRSFDCSALRALVTCV